MALDPNTAERWVPDSLDTMLDYVWKPSQRLMRIRVYVMGYMARWAGLLQMDQSIAGSFCCGCSLWFYGWECSGRCEEARELTDLGDGGQRGWEESSWN